MSGDAKTPGEVGTDAPIIVVSMNESLWRALLSIEPYAKETYTGEGEAILNAFQQVREQTNIEAP